MNASSGDEDAASSKDPGTISDLLDVIQEGSPLVGPPRGAQETWSRPTVVASPESGLSDGTHVRKAYSQTEDDLIGQLVRPGVRSARTREISLERETPREAV